MSAFYVGQRVRVKATENEFLKHLVGAELVIISDEPCHGEPCWWVNASSARGKPAGALKHDAPYVWEPILPEGAAPSEFATLADLLTSLNVEVPA